jgi:hypothetical protein
VSMARAPRERIVSVVNFRGIPYSLVGTAERGKRWGSAQKVNIAKRMRKPQS